METHIVGCIWFHEDFSPRCLYIVLIFKIKILLLFLFFPLSVAVSVFLLVCFVLLKIQDFSEESNSPIPGDGVLQHSP